MVGGGPLMVPVLGVPVIDRPEISSPLLDALTDESDTVLSLRTALEGAGGFGKTTLAAHVCNHPRIAERFTGGILWTTVGESTQGARLARLISNLHQALAGEKLTTSDPMLAGARLGAALDRCEPTLLVIDDVWRASQLAPFLMGGKHARRLVTTRIRDAIPHGARVFSVDEMSTDQARRALTANSGDLPFHLADRLLHLTGRWPVLIGLANATLLEYVASGAVASNAARWLIERLEYDGPAALDMDDAHSRNRAVSATMAASLDLLSEEERECYFGLAIFPEDYDIPTEILELAWSSVNVGGVPHRRLYDKLVRLRLATGRWQSRFPALRLHDTIRAYLRHEVTPAGLVRRQVAFLEAAERLLDDTAEGGGPVPWWTLPSGGTYLWHQLTYHLHHARKHDDLLQLVLDLRWAEAKILAVGNTISLEADLALVDEPRALELRRAIGRSAAMLAPLQPPAALGATLASRLTGYPRLAPLVHRYRASLVRPHLEDAWPSPDQPEPALLRGFQAHEDWIRSCAFSPSGALLATSADDKTVRAWRIDTGRLAWTLTGHTAPVADCAFSPDGSVSATGSFDGTVRLWQPDGEPRAAIAAHAGWVRRCRFSPDGSSLLSVGDDGAVRLWDAARLVLRRSYAGHRGPVLSGAFSTDGAIIVTTSADHTIRVWSARSGAELAVFDTADSIPIGCAFTPDGAMLAVGDDAGVVRVWRTGNWSVVNVLRGHNGAVNDCTFSPDSRLFVTVSSDRMVVVWDTRTWRAIRTLGGHEAPVTRCTFSSNVQMLATVGFDRLLMVWEPSAIVAEAETSARHADCVRGCAFSVDGALLATASDDRTARIWDTRTGALLTTLTGHTDWVRSCAFSVDGTLLATASDDHTARIWNAQTGGPVAVLSGHHSWLSACRLSPDGRTAITASFDGAVKLWSLQDEPLQRLLLDGVEPVSGCEFSPDGSLAVATTVEGRVYVVEIASGHVTTLPVRSGWLYAAAFSRDGQRVAVVGEDGIPRVWDIHRGRCLAAIRVAQPLFGCAWHPQDDVICAVGRAGVYLFRYLT